LSDSEPTTTTNKTIVEVIDISSSPDVSDDDFAGSLSATKRSGVKRNTGSRSEAGEGISRSVRGFGVMGRKNINQEVVQNSSSNSSNCSKGTLNRSSNSSTVPNPSGLPSLRSCKTQNRLEFIQSQLYVAGGWPGGLLAFLMHAATGPRLQMYKVRKEIDFLDKLLVQRPTASVQVPVPYSQ
jgi:hypothetical protein